MQILDHGYLRLVETWGADERIIEAARMSTGKGFNGWGPVHDPVCATRRLPSPARQAAECDCKPKEGDERLLRFLWTHKHATPFEMAGMVVEVQAPIFVFREWHRHRTQSYNEMSARYIPLPALDYVPSVERLMAQAGANRQAQAQAGVSELTVEAAEVFREQLQLYYDGDENLYQEALGLGVPKELARLILPVGRYSRMRASANLRNWLAFLTLRMDPAAMWEIRQYADAVGVLVAEHFPRTWALFREEA